MDTGACNKTGGGMRCPLSRHPGRHGHERASSLSAAVNPLASIAAANDVFFNSDSTFVSRTRVARRDGGSEEMGVLHGRYRGYDCSHRTAVAAIGQRRLHCFSMRQTLK